MAKNSFIWSWSDQYWIADKDLWKLFGETIKVCARNPKKQAIEAFLSSTLRILRCISAGQVLIRFREKIVVSVVKKDVVKTTGSLQNNTVQKAELEK